MQQKLNSLKRAQTTKEKEENTNAYVYNRSMEHLPWVTRCLEIARELASMLSKSSSHPVLFLNPLTELKGYSPIDFKCVQFSEYDSLNHT